MLREACCFAECFRCIVLGITGIVRPLFGFKRVDDILSAHEVDITTAEIVTKILVFLLCVKADDRLAGHSRVGKNELEKIRLTLSGIAEDEDVGVCLVIASSVKVHDDVRAELISAEIESVRIGFARIVEGITVGDSGCRKDPFELGSECVVSARHTGNKAFFLPERKPVDRELLSCQLHCHICL